MASDGERTIAFDSSAPFRPSLGLRVIVSLVMVWVALLAGTHLILTSVVEPSYVELEKKSLEDDLHRVEAALREDLESIAKSAEDYARWDLMVRYAREGDPNFEEESLDHSIFATLGVDLVVVFDEKGSCRFSRSQDHESGRTLSRREFDPDFLRGKLPKISHFSGPGLSSGGHLTVLRFDDGALLELAALPITRSDGSGPVAGLVVMGRILGEKVVKILRDRVRLPFSLVAPGSIDRSIDRVPLLENDNASIRARWLDDKKSEVFGVVIERSAKIVSAGKRTLTITTVSTLAVLSLVLVVLLFILQVSIVAPLGRLSKTIAHIQSTGNLGTRVDLERNDEIGELASNFDRMLELLGERAERLERLASYDELTGLHNRRFVMEYLKDDIEAARRYGHDLAVLLIDVDHFKRLNDTAGHAAGDLALANVAKILRLSLRETDRVGRYGGEEFLVVLPHQDIEGAVIVAERIRKAIEASEELGVGWPVTVSIGVSPWEGQNREALLFCADKNLYRAKSEGRNRVVARAVSPEDIPGSSLLRGGHWSRFPPLKLN